MGDSATLDADDVTVVGSLAYLSGYGGLSIVDISDPRRPRMRGSVQRPAGQDVTVAGGGAAAEHGHIAVIGGHAYVAQYNDILVFDVRDPDHPIFVTQHSSNWGYRGLQAANGQLYAAAYRFTDKTYAESRGGLLVMDIQHPAQLRVAAALETTKGSVNALVVDGTTAVVDGPTGLAVVDLAMPLRPRLVRRLEPLALADGDLATEDGQSLAIRQGLVLASVQTWSDEGPSRYFGAYDLTDPGSAPKWTRSIFAYNNAAPWIDSDQVIMLAEGSVFVHDVRTGERLGESSNRTYDASRVVPLPDGLALAVGTQNRLRILRLRADAPCPSISLAPTPTAPVRAPGLRAYLPLVAVNAAKGCLADCEPPPPLAQVGGAWGEMVLRAPYAYLAHGPRLDVLDLSDPARPVLAGQSDPLAGGIRSLALDGRRAIVVDNAYRLWVLDLGDPRRPRTLGSVFLADDDRTGLTVDDGIGLTTRDGVAFVGDATNLWAVSLGDGTKPQVVRRLPLSSPYGEEIDRDRGQGGAPVLLGDLLITHPFTFDRWSLSIFDVSDPTNPRFVRIEGLPGGLTSDVVTLADHVYLVTVSDDAAFTLRTFALRAGQLVEVSAIPVGPVRDLMLSGGQLYLADYPSDRSIRRYDLVDPDQPVWRASEPRGAGWAMALAGDGDLLLARRADDSFDTLRRDGEDRLPRLGRYLGPGSAYDLAATGGVAVMADGGQLWTLDPDTLAVLGNVPLSVPITDYFDQASLPRIRPVGRQHVAAISSEGDGNWRLSIIGLADPRRPRVLADMPLADGTFQASLATDGAVVVVALLLSQDGVSASARLMVWDVADPAHPRPLSSLSIPSCCAVSASHGYVIVGGYGTAVVDLRDPGVPRIVAGSNALDDVGQVALDGRTAYLLGSRDGLRGLSVLDLADPSAPRALGSQFAGELSLMLDPPLAFAAAGTFGVDLLDVSSTAAPRRLAELATLGRARSVVASGDRVLVAGESSGVWAYDRSRLQALRTLWGPGEHP
jgi:hypothetical protein